MHKNTHPRWEDGYVTLKDYGVVVVPSTLPGNLKVVPLVVISIDGSVPVAGAV